MKNYFIAFFITLLFSTNIFAQLKKGDWSFSLLGRVSVTGEIEGNTDFTSSSLNPSAGKMLTDNWMVGSGIRLFASTGLGEESSFLSSSSFGVSPFVRYYRQLQPKLMGFGFLETNLLQRNMDEGITNPEEGFTYWGTVGLGADLFIAPNVALEFKAGTQLFNGGDFNVDRTNSNRAFINIGFKTFLVDRFAEEFNLQENYLRKGNYVLSGTAGFSIYDNIRIGLVLTPEEEELNGYQFNVSTGLEYFRTDNWVIGGSAGVFLTKVNSNHRLNSSLAASSKYYQPINENLFFVPSVNLLYSRSTTNGDYIRYLQADGEEITCGDSLIFPFFTEQANGRRMSNIIGGEVSASLVYFTQSNALLEGGISVSHNINYFEGEKMNDRTQARLFVGAEYFVAKNLALYGSLGYSFMDTQNHCGVFGFLDDKVHSGALSFGVKYFIFNDKNQID